MHGRKWCSAGGRIPRRLTRATARLSARTVSLLANSSRLAVGSTHTVPRLQAAHSGNQSLLPGSGGVTPKSYSYHTVNSTILINADRLSNACTDFAPVTENSWVSAHACFARGRVHADGGDGDARRWSARWLLLRSRRGFRVYWGKCARTPCSLARMPVCVLECADSTIRGGAPQRARNASGWTPDSLLLQRPTCPTASSDPIRPLHLLLNHAVSILVSVRAREVVLPSLPFHRSITSSPENHSCSFQTRFSPISSKLKHNRASSFDPPTSKYPQVA